MPKQILVNGKPIRYDRVPVEYMADGLKHYFEDGISPGSFMRAVLCNDLMEAAACADDTNRRRLWDWACWLYNHAPRGSYGSAEKFEDWLREASAWRDC